MGKDAQNAVVLTEDAAKKLQQCVTALADCGFGVEGPPKDTAFAQIEDFGHEAGRMVARAVDEELAARHASHFQQDAACPTCGTDASPKQTPATRDLQTTDGHIPIREPVCHCSACCRDFFPSTYRVEN